jgi:hypothetical protein
MIDLYNNATQQLIGSLTEAQLRVLIEGLNRTTRHWYSVAQREKTLTVRSERSRVSGAVEEPARRESSGLRLRCATLRPNRAGNR